MSTKVKSLPAIKNISWLSEDRGTSHNTITMPFKGVIPDVTPYVGWKQVNYTYAYQAQYYVKARLIPSKQLDTGSKYSSTKWKYFNSDWSGKVDSLNRGADPDKKHKWYRYYSLAGKSLMTEGSYDKLEVIVRVRSYGRKKKQHGNWYTETLTIKCVPTVKVHKVVALADGGCYVYLDTGGWTRGGSKVIFETIKRNDTAELEALAAAETVLVDKAAVMTTAQSDYDSKKLESDTAKDALAVKYQDLAIAQSAFDMLPEDAAPEEIEAAQLAITDAQAEVEAAQAVVDIAQDETDAAKAVLDAAAAEVEAATANRDAAQAAVDAYKPINKKTLELDMSAPGAEAAAGEEDAERPYVIIKGSDLNEGLQPNEDIKFLDCKFRTCDGVDAPIDGVVTIDPVSAFIDAPEVAISTNQDTGLVSLDIKKVEMDDDWDDCSAWMEVEVRGEKRRLNPAYQSFSEDAASFRFLPPLDSKIELWARITNDLGGWHTFVKKLPAIPSRNRFMFTYTDGTDVQPGNGEFNGSKIAVLNYETEISTDAKRESSVELPHGRKRPIAFLAEGLTNTISISGSIGAILDGSLETEKFSGYYDWLAFQQHQGIVLIRMPNADTYYAVCTKISIDQEDENDESKSISLSFEEVEV